MLGVGIEPTYSEASTRRLYRLSYPSICESGRNRTSNLMVKSHLLCQLSYKLMLLSFSIFRKALTIAFRLALIPFIALDQFRCPRLLYLPW